MTENVTDIDTAIPGDELADMLTTIRDGANRWPWTGLGDIDAVAAIDWRGALTLAAERLRRVGIPLDEITETPARNSDPRSSHLAINSLNATTSRGAVALAFYKSRFGYGETGITSVGAFRRAGITSHKSPWKRVSDLKNAGIIAPTGELVEGDRGRMVEVLAITEFGVAEVERLMPDEAAAVKANALVQS